MKLSCKKLNRRINFSVLFLIAVAFYQVQPLAFAGSSIRGLDAYEWNRIDATKNARQHNNMGNIYFEEKNYINALKEYEIAYNLTHNSSTSSTYLYNIARCFIAINNYSAAKNALLGAIKKDCINITYYETLTDCYIKLGIQEEELKKTLKDNSNPYNRIIAGLIYLKTGRKTTAKILFDEFINENPKMIITEDVKEILRRIN